MNMRSNTKKGSATVEAAIVLPLFFLAIVAIGWLMKAAAIEEDMGFAAMNEGRQLAMTAYHIDCNPLFPIVTAAKITGRTEEVRDVKIGDYRYLYRAGETDQLIHFSLTYKTDAKLPFFDTALSPEMHFTMRAFRGCDNTGTASYAELEKEEESEEVWVFPRYGERYHTEGCSFISVYPRKVFLNAKVKRSYTRCKTCDSDRIADGHPVYCFKAGGSYHYGSCPTVDKYVVRMEKRDAQSRGYTPCLKCGG